jgi:hypothetical protein
MAEFRGWITVGPDAPLTYQIRDHVERGWQVVSTDGVTFAVVRKPSERLDPAVHILMFIISILTWGLGLIAWALVAWVDSKNNAEQTKRLTAPDSDIASMFHPARPSVADPTFLSDNPESPYGPASRPTIERNPYHARHERNPYRSPHA